MGNVMVMLDWPSATQLAAGACCGLVTFIRSGGGGYAEEMGGGAGRGARKAVAAAVGAAAALAILDALLGRLARRSPIGNARGGGGGRGGRRAVGLVVLTGCDSGLGFSLAAHSLRMGLRVVAGCLDQQGAGARNLRALAPRHARLTVLPLDVTNPRSVEEFQRGVEALLADDQSVRLLGLVNNAGVMVFGEFEWQTPEQIEKQVQVNLLGTMRVTRALCPLLRRHKGRIVTVTSHCALEPLPGLAPYGATKAALDAWSTSLRVEQAKYGVRVVTLVPGSFSQTSNIMAMHEQHAQEMEAKLRQDHPLDWEFYEDYFRAYHEYLLYISGYKAVKELNDRRLYFKYECSLLALWPKHQYVHAPMRYNVYHLAMRLAPRFVRDWIVNAFMKLPQFKGK